jgi:hypothetical protein
MAIKIFLEHELDWNKKVYKDLTVI